MKPVRFNEALRVAAEATQIDNLTPESRVRIIRDVYGKLRFAVNTLAQDFPPEILAKLDEARTKLGVYAGAGGIVFRDNFADPEAIFNHPDWHETIVPGKAIAEDHVTPDLSIHLLDRQIIGQDWLHTAEIPAVQTAPPRIVFYGIKGGVGRSTALAMLAYLLAREGKRVLLLDFDLESPGLSGLLLPPERMAGYGLADWFIEDALGQGDGVLDDLVVDSPLAEHTTGSIRITSAMGQEESAYLAKLARVYADIPSPTGPQRFADRMKRLVEALEARESPDVVLIDSRAGLHDLAAISIARLATLALLFATDSPQNWQGYRQLFSHWQHRPEVSRQVRNRLAIVQALFPESDQEARARRFLERAYDLFSETLYDQVEAGADIVPDAFTFDLESEEAPHFPLRVRWNARFQEFNPLLAESRGGVSETDIELAFGPFARSVKALICEG